MLSTLDSRIETRQWDSVDKHWSNGFRR